MKSILDIENNKEKCQKFTPLNIVENMLDIAGYTTDLVGKKVLENSFGSGNILKGIVRRYIQDAISQGISSEDISIGVKNDIYGIELDKKLYNECINELDEIIEEYRLPKVEWSLYNEDALEWCSPVKFQFIIGNPPYIAYRYIDEDNRVKLKKKYTTCFKGKFDYCYAFIEKSINSLADNGKMSYLIPSSIYKTVFGHNLRIFMSPYIAQIKDYKQVKIFDKALVKSSIMVLDKQRQQEILHYQDMSMENAIDIPIAQLDEKWFFADENEVGQHRFGDYFKVSHVVATLLNKAYVLSDGAYTEVDNGYVCGNHTIEREVVRNTETPRTLRYIKHEKIIFPYTYDENELVHYDDGEFERLYPGATAYLNEFRDDLDKRQSDNNAKWYEYGRSQALSGLNRQKLLISTVVTNDVDVYELEQECIPYAGMYIVEKEDNNEYELTDAMRILRSGEFKEYVFKVGIPISGKSVRITSKDVENYMF